MKRFGQKLPKTLFTRSGVELRFGWYRPLRAFGSRPADAGQLQGTSGRLRQKSVLSKNCSKRLLDKGFSKNKHCLHTKCVSNVFVTYTSFHTFCREQKDFLVVQEFV
jgi:hypothetical protein